MTRSIWEVVEREKGEDVNGRDEVIPITACPASGLLFWSGIVALQVRFSKSWWSAGWLQVGILLPFGGKSSHRQFLVFL